MGKQAIYYVYGVVSEGLALPQGLMGVGEPPEAVSVIRADGLQAIVSPTADELGPDPSAVNTMAHQRVLTTVMEHGPVVPFSFGQVLPEGVLMKLMATARDQILQLLTALDGKIQVGLKMLWKKDSFLSEIETPEIAALRADIERAPAPHKQVQLGELLQLAADEQRAWYRDAVYEPLAAQAVSGKLGDEIGPRMILNASFLIEKAGEAAFDALVGQVCQPFMERLDIRYTGPWPPYSFVTIRFRLEEGAGDVSD